MSRIEQHADKPEPIRVGVEGFVAFEAKPATIPWGRVLGLPAFQMFMAERHGAINMASFKPQPELYDEYCQWHVEKGYWPNEGPLGNLKHGEGADYSSASID